MNLSKLLRLEKTRKGVTTLLVAALVAALSYGFAGFVVRHTSPKFQLTAGTGFTITSTISAWPGCTGTAASFSPTVERCLTYEVHNALSVPITVTSLSVTGVARSTTTVTHTTCNPALSTFTTTAFSGHLFVPKKTTNTQGEPITYKTTATNQTPCAGAKLTFTYYGTAHFTDGTKTTLAGPSPNPAKPGVTVTFTATVTATNPTYDTSKPSGTVTFVTCASALTCTTPTGTLGMRTVTTSTGKATLTTSFATAKKYYVEARYGGTGTNFSASTSNIVTEFVGSTCGTLAGCLVFKPSPAAEPARSSTNHAIGSIVDTAKTGVVTAHTPVIVEVITATGGADKTYSGTVTVSLLGNPSTSTLSGTKTVTVVTGLAKYYNLRINHAGSYRLHAIGTPTSGTAPTPTTSTRFNIDTKLKQCTLFPCSLTTTLTHTINLKETTTTTTAGYIALGQYGTPTKFTCRTPNQLTPKHDATVEVLTRAGVSTGQHRTTWTITYTVAKSFVKTTGPQGASHWGICWASLTTFKGTGKVNKVTLTTGGGPVTYYVGLLATCSKKVAAPCILSRHKDNAGREIITVQAAGDSYVRP